VSRRKRLLTEARELVTKREESLAEAVKEVAELESKQAGSSNGDESSK
jgi:hypothetical protein